MDIFVYFLFSLPFINWLTEAPADSYEQHYDVVLIALSYMTSVFGAFVGLRFVDKALTVQSTRTRIHWLLLAAISVGGCAIWAMHFIGMLAFHIGIDMSYDLLLTMFSMLVAIVVTGCGLIIIGFGKQSWLKWVMTGIFMGLGIAGMHYTGMAAMIMEADLVYIPSLFILSIVIAIVASIAALWIFLHARKLWQQLISALIMGVAVCGMHYTGMAAAVFIPNPHRFISNEASLLLIDRSDFIIYIAIAILITLILIISMSMPEETKEE